MALRLPAVGPDWGDGVVSPRRLAWLETELVIHIWNLNWLQTWPDVSWLYSDGGLCWNLWFLRGRR